MPGEAGCRNRLVTIQQSTDSQGSTGYPVETWTYLGSAWMERIDLRGSERFAADQLSAVGDVTFVMPYQANIDPEVIDVPKVRRLQCEGRTYDIKAAKPLGYHDRIELQTLVKTG